MPDTASPPRHIRSRRPASPGAELARLAKALGHPTRVRMLRLLAHTPRCCHGSLADELPLAASTVSQHLRILCVAGLIQGEVDGPRTGYCIDRDHVEQGAALLHALAEARPQGSRP